MRRLRSEGRGKTVGRGWRDRWAADDGFSLTELIVAGALTAVFGALTVLVLAQVQQVGGALSSRSITQVEARQTLDLAVRNLRNARPPGTCENPPGAASLADCLRVGTSTVTPAVFYATNWRLCYFAYVTAVTAPTQPVVPRAVCLGRPTATNNNVEFQQWASTSGDYVSAWSTLGVGAAPGGAPTETFRLGATPNTTTPLFTYYDRFNRPLCASWPTTTPGPTEVSTCPAANTSTSPLSLAGLRQISRVEIALTYTSSEYRSAVPQQFTTSVSLRGSRYANEQTWDGGIG